MSIDGISSTYSAYQPSSAQGNFKQIRQDFKNLATALQSGDLSGAQDAFSALQHALQSVQQNRQSQSQSSSTQDKFSADIAALGKALEAGDLTAAQDAFKQLQQDMQAVVVTIALMPHKTPIAPLCRQWAQAPAARPTATATTTEPARIGSILPPERERAAHRSWSAEFARNQFVDVQLAGEAKLMPEQGYLPHLQQPSCRF